MTVSRRIEYLKAKETRIALSIKEMVESLVPLPLEVVRIPPILEGRGGSAGNR